MANNKYNIDKVRIIVRNLGYELISNEYINNKQKLIFKDNNGYYYNSKYNNILHGFIPSKFEKRNPYTIQNIKLWLKLNNKSFELITNIYNGNSKKMQWKCLKEECGEVFEANWGNISQGNSCSYCDGKKVGIYNCLATKNPEISKEWHPTLNGELTPYDVTLNSNKKVWWQCSKNQKHVWYISINNRNNTSCPYCAGQMASEDYNLLFINPILCEEWNYDKNNKKPEDYTPNSGQKVWWKCKDCGHEWKTSVDNRTNGRGCPECSESHGEIRIREWLKQNNIKYEPQKEFEGLIGLGNGNLSYDFYVFKFNLLIEYQGQYHDQVILNYKNETIGFAEERLKKQQEHDRRKREYAKKHNIKLLEIWYWDYDNIETILEKELLNK